MTAPPCDAPDSRPALALPAIEEEAWRFATAFYAFPGMASACIALQDQGDIDVCLLLTMAYASAVRRLPVDDAIIRAANDHVRGWRDDVVRPLRRARRATGGDASHDPSVARLHDALKAEELRAERIEIRQLEAWLARQALAPVQLLRRPPAEMVIEALASAPVDPSLRQVVAQFDHALDRYLAEASPHNDA